MDIRFGQLLLDNLLEVLLTEVVRERLRPPTDGSPDSKAVDHDEADGDASTDSHATGSGR